MSARTANVTLDCDDVLAQAAFWSAVLGRAVDAGSSPYFASIGVTDGERREPAWYFNQVPGPKQAKNRLHIDLADPDPDAIARLTGLGATVIGAHDAFGHSWTVLQDPEGNEFCLAARIFTGFGPHAAAG